MRYTILTIAAAITLASCQFESDKDYKKFDKDGNEIKAGHEGSGAGHGQHEASNPSHDAGQPAHGSGSSGHENAAAHGAEGTTPGSAGSNSSESDSSKSAGSAVGAGAAASNGTGSASGSGAVAGAKRKGSATASEWKSDAASKIEMDAEGVYGNVEVMPEFPGGKKAIQKFIEDNIQYPQSAIDDDIEGTVQITFNIDEQGRVYKATANGKALGHGLDQEAVRVVKKMPKWTPGKVKGKAVKTRLSLPVVFLLS